VPPRSLCRFRSDRLHQRIDWPILPAVRLNHRHLDCHQRLQFAHSEPSTLCNSSATSPRPGRLAHPDFELSAGLVLLAFQPRFSLVFKLLFQNRAKPPSAHGGGAGGVCRSPRIHLLSLSKHPKRVRPAAGQTVPGRLRTSDLLTLKVRNKRDQLVPLGSVVKVSDSSGPDRAEHYNSYLTAPINGAPGKGYSSGQAEAAMTRIVSETLPNGMSAEWTELAYQKVIAGNTAIYIFPLCVLLVFLVLAAQYENLRLPLAVVLIVPLCLLFALVGLSRCRR
jgi:AcrB/AcrD/AcrF family